MRDGFLPTPSSLLSLPTHFLCSSSTGHYAFSWTHQACSISLGFLLWEMYMAPCSPHWFRLLVQHFLIREPTQTTLPETSHSLLSLWPYSASFCSIEFTLLISWLGEGSGTPLQYSCLENPKDGGAWWAAVRGVAKSRTRLSNLTFTFHFHALEKEMATHSSVLAWTIPGTEEPGGLPSMGSHRVKYDWSDSAAAAAAYLDCPSSLEGKPHRAVTLSWLLILFVSVCLLFDFWYAGHLPRFLVNKWCWPVSHMAYGTLGARLVSLP